jgi:hypothetical protein
MFNQEVNSRTKENRTCSIGNINLPLSQICQNDQGMDDLRPFDAGINVLNRCALSTYQIKIRVKVTNNDVEGNEPL